MKTVDLARALLKDLETYDKRDAVENYHGFLYAIAAARSFADSLARNYNEAKAPEEYTPIKDIVKLTVNEFPELKPFLKLNNCDPATKFPTSRGTIRLLINRYVRDLKGFGFDG